MSRLPAVLGTDDLPLAELCAARLDGDVIAWRDGFVPIDEPDLPALRARLLALGVDRALVLDRRSAAWVHGAGQVAPARTQFCVDASARTTVRAELGHVREVTLDPGDVELIGEVRCTTRARTVYDLVRDPDSTAADLGLVAQLLQPQPAVAVAVRDRLEGAFRLPYKRAALARLDDATVRAGSVRLSA
ncbi:hypothetical protein ABIQ69_07720 [Agromyces sp. G08B096]|uniref:AbiEi antitoxin C-terminal domain-containing protein n=1 Tax=Agromyces sp. G08B096 TaxID=3156399 RepID=A0AAU7WDF9_9MICO